MQSKVIRAFRERARSFNWSAYIRYRSWKSNYYVTLVDTLNLNNEWSFEATENTLDSMFRTYKRRSECLEEEGVELAELVHTSAEAAEDSSNVLY